MKGIKIITIITTISLLIMAIISPVYAEEKNSNYGEFYPRLSIVIEVHADTVICQDKEGNLWAFFSDNNEWEKGDICNLMMWNLSPDTTQHEIVEVYWEGYTEDIELFFQMMKWR